MTQQQPVMPQVPPEGAHIWSAFRALNARRPGEWTSQPITYGEIAAFMAVTDTPLLPWEVEIVIAIDDEMLAFNAEQAKQ